MSPVPDVQNGISGGGYAGTNITIVRGMTAFAAIAWYNGIELLIMIFIVFKKYKGLYFWSLLITSFSIIPYETGAWMKQVQITDNNMLCITLSTVGWTFMVSGQLVVLYSRLHLVTQNRTLLRSVLTMIIVNVILLWIPTTVLAYGSQTEKSDLFVNGYAIMEKIQMTIWSVQEIIISGIYIYEVRKILHVVYHGGTRKILYELVAINVAIIALDIGLLTVEFFNLYQIEVTLKGMVYSIKLKLEFGVLSKLVKIVTGKGAPGRVASHDDALVDLDMFPQGVVANMSPSVTITGDSIGKPEAHHVEYVESEGEGSNGYRIGTEGLAPDLLEGRRRVSRRSSITDLYPGRLGG